MSSFVRRVVTVKNSHRIEDREFSRHECTETTPEPRAFADRGHQRAACGPVAKCSYLVWIASFDEGALILRRAGRGRRDR